MAGAPGGYVSGMDERERGTEREERGRVQHPPPGPEPAPDEPAGPPADPDRPTDEIRRGNTLVEPAPGD